MLVQPNFETSVSNFKVVESWKIMLDVEKSLKFHDMLRESAEIVICLKFENVTLHLGCFVQFKVFGSVAYNCHITNFLM